jgi:hypothetical protein
MVRHVLGGFERAAVLQEHGDAGSPEGVIAERFRQTRRQAALLDDAQHVPAGERSRRSSGGFCPASETALLRAAVQRYGTQIRIEKLLRLVMQPDELFLAAFFDHAQPGALAFEPVIAALSPATALTRAKV